MNGTIRLIRANDCKNHNKGVLSIVGKIGLVENTDDLWVDSTGHIYIVRDNVAHKIEGYSLVGASHDARSRFKNLRCFDDETEGTEFIDGDDFIEPFLQGGASMEDKYKWQESYTKFSVQLHNEKDKEIIDEAKRRKDKYNTATSYTMRRWVRLGYEADKRED